MRSRTPIVVLGLAVALAGCESEPYRAPGATGATSEHELPGNYAESDLDPLTAQRYVDHVRIGRGVDPEGEISDGLRADTFRVGEPVHIGMEVTDAPAGSAIRVAVHDAETDATVWTGERNVPPGRSHMHFAIDARKLHAGKYRAKVIIGDETVAERDFEVS